MDKIAPETSIIVPVLNEAKYLESTLDSIVNQNTNIPYELIVVDNGSTDESMYFSWDLLTANDSIHMLSLGDMNPEQIF